MDLDFFWALLFRMVLNKNISMRGSDAMTCCDSADAIKNGKMNGDMERLKKMFEPYKESTGVVSYDKSTVLRDELTSYINDVICGELLEGLRYRDVFDVTSLIMEEICQLVIDDSGQITESLMYRCKYIIIRVINRSNDDELKKDIFDWLNGIVELEEKEYVDDQIKSLWLKNFFEQPYMSSKLDTARRKIDSCAGACKNRGWQECPGLSEWLRAFFYTAGRMQLSDAEVMPVAEKFRTIPEVRDCLVKWYLDAERYDEAVKVLRESMALEADDPGRVASCSRQIVDIYEEMGDRWGMKEELKAIVFRYDRGSLEDFRRLKSCYSIGLWKKLRDGILEELKDEPGIGRLYCEEEMFEKLMEFVAADGSIEVLDEFRPVLKNRYREEMLALYEKIVREKLAHARAQRHYRSMTSVMRKMKDIPGGDVVIEDLDEEFRIRYPNNMSMINELDILYREKIKRGGIILLD